MDSDKGRDNIDGHSYTQATLDATTIALRSASSNVQSNSRLALFLYHLMRDKLPTGEVEELVLQALVADETIVYTNGWLAQYALNIESRLSSKCLTDDASADENDRLNTKQKTVELSIPIMCDEHRKPVCQCHDVNFKCHALRPKTVNALGDLVHYCGLGPRGQRPLRETSKSRGIVRPNKTCPLHTKGV